MRSVGFGHRGRATRFAILGVGLALVVAGTAIALGIGLQNPGFDSGLAPWTRVIDRPAGNGVPGDGQGKPNRQVVYGPGGSEGTVVPCRPNDRYGVCLITGNDTFTTTSGVTKTVVPRTPTRMLRLGGPYLNPYQKQTVNHRFMAEQTFQVDPAMPDLKIRNKLFTYDSNPHYQGRDGGRDRLEIEVLDSAGNLIRRHVRVARDSGEGKRLVGLRWRGMRVNLAGYAGQSVTLRVGLVGRRDRLRGTWAYIDPALVSRPTRTLTVALTGNGGGTVTAPGISCPPDCTETYPAGASFDVSSAPAGGSVFAGFAGPCNGLACHLTMRRSELLSAVFNSTNTVGGDNRAPKVKIKGPHGRVKVHKRAVRLKFKLVADEANVSFKCKIDRRKAKQCKSRYRTPQLKLGSHKLTVTATDAAGNRSAPAKRSFKLVRARG